MDFNAISSVVETEFEAVNKLILKQLYTNVPLVDQVAKYIVGNGGKRLRPLVSLLAAKACSYEGDEHIRVAAVVEFLHTATLLHDDVVDESNLRRGRATVNARWGNAPSILVGDFLLSRSFQMIVAIRNMRIMEILSEATNVIAEGEVLQLVNCKDPDTSEASYMTVIEQKTAKMFEAAAQSGAVLAEQPPEIEQALVEYAIQLGSAFQMVDDLLDYDGNAAEMGKNVGDDLAEGKATLPLIYAIQAAPTPQAQMIREAIATGGTERIEEISAIVQQCGALKYTKDKAVEASKRACQALEVIPDSIYKDAMIGLAKLAVDRTT